MHLDRLFDSAQSLSEINNTLTRAKLEEGVVPEVQSAMGHFLQGSKRDELKVTVLYVSPSEIWTHIAPLKPPRSSPIRIQLAGSPRENATTKDSEWVRQRQALEAAKPEDVEDVVLVGAGGTLVEGTQTNFFGVVDGAVWTADEGVLAGSVRKVALEVCEDLQIPIILQPPTIEQLRSGKMDGAFISSTSRLVMPIDTVLQPDGSEKALDAHHPIVAQISQRVQEEVAQRSTLVRVV